jgi:predicted nucleic acid-binding protein
MRYLLDVNALVAAGFLEHEQHQRTVAWLRTLSESRDNELLTCSITELGFVRVMAQATHYGFTVLQAKTLLVRLKNSKVLRFGFLSDDQDISHLPAWAKSPKQTTDAHLAELARSHGAILASLDRGIPGVFLIPG